MTGTLATDTLATLQCSADAPCSGIKINGVEGVRGTGGVGVGEEVVSCSNVVGLGGVGCTEGS